MRHTFIPFLIFTGCFCFPEIQAQVRQGTIIDSLETFTSDEGIIQVCVDPKLKELIGIPSPEASAGEDNFFKISGFRIRVFMSSSRTARKEVSDKGNLIKEVFPEIGVYDDYVAPNWKLLVGDFRTKEEAEIFKQKMLKSVQGIGKEMIIVTDKIHIPIQKSN